MILYRVSNYADLTGRGGEFADGRWHTRQQGRRVVYLADHPALCLLETIVHVERDDEMPDTYQLLSVEIPDRLIEPIDSNLLPLVWQENIAITQHIGNTWLSASKKAGLLVPSVIVPVAKNCILNPLVPEVANVKPQVVGRFPFDKRLLSR
ncbi:RES family NAD+ phosphorylase [Edaphobacter aggregans]|uniref:RES family NAD+ phosphorylase n=1 Tax=Edaphobacter aggregans TaxID=570835 RepID=UPI0005567A68|nr:RES family NAD+ phosphorylase [Edaphobacter aggregans]